MFKIILILVAATIVMAGCAGTSVVPRNPSATYLILPVFSDKWEHGVVQLAEKNSNGCGYFSKNVLPKAFDKDVTLNVEGNKDIFFHISRSGAKNECNYYGIFYAAKGNDYFLNIASKDDVCVVTLIEKKQNGSQNKINTYPAHESKVDGIRVCENKDRLY